MRIVALIGNPKPGSRTLGIAQALAARVATSSDEVATIDLAGHVGEIFSWPSEAMAELGRRVAESDLVIVGSPTYKAAYTGLLKSFLDRYPNLGLAGVCAIPLMTGADNGHSMAPEVTLRPLLVELGALVPTQALYFETPRIDQMDMILDQWMEANALGIQQIRAAAEWKATV